MELQISKRALTRLALLAALPILVLSVYRLGAAVTPYTQDGAPILLSPSMRQSMAYRRQALEWTRQLRDTDAYITRLQSQRQDVYEQTRQADAILSSSLQVAQEIELRRAPAALVGLQTLLADASQRYYTTAQDIAQWVGAPSPENAEAVGNDLAAARVALNTLSESRWLAEEIEVPPARQRDDRPVPTPDTLDLPSP
jgi:hypothetical protein